MTIGWNTTAWKWIEDAADHPRCTTRSTIQDCRPLLSTLPVALKCFKGGDEVIIDGILIARHEVSDYKGRTSKEYYFSTIRKGDPKSCNEDPQSVESGEIPPNDPLFPAMTDFLIAEDSQTIY